MSTIPVDTALQAFPPGAKRERLRELCGQRALLTASDVLGLEIHASDRLWLVLQMDALTAEHLRLFAAWCALRVPVAFKQEFSVDDRVWECILVAQRLARGSATAEDLDAACKAAASTVEWLAWYAATWSAWMVVEAAMAATPETWEARSEAFRAAWTATRNAQIDCVRHILSGKLNMSVPVAQWPPYGWPSAGGAT